MVGRGASSKATAPFIKEIRPTIYFIEESDGLKQGVDIVIGNPKKVAYCRIALGLGRKTCEFDVGAVRKGSSTRRIYIPDIREKGEVRFRLVTDGTTVDAKRVKWEPQRHWTVYLVQTAHFDPGYTDLPSNVMHEYLGFLDDVVAWCKRTARWPVEARFRYVVEQAWVAWHYVNNRPPDAVKRFAHYCKTGQIEVNAFFGNMISDLLGPEQAARLLYPAFELKRRYGIPIRTAEHNDVPGMAWSLATVLADAGIKYLSLGVPDYFDPSYVGRERAARHGNFADEIIRPHDCPEAFRWTAQDGRKILVYLHRQGVGGDCDTNLADMPGVLEKLEAEGYKYDAFRYCLRGGLRDNSPPLFGFAETVKVWNAKWAYPKYVMATNSMFFKALERERGKEVPTQRRHWPDTDYAMGATSTAQETGVNRIAKDFLLAGERLAAIASEVADYEYPRRFLDEAHLDTLKYDEHVWGLSAPFGWGADGHRKEKSLYAYRAAALADDVIVKSVNRIADEIALDDDAYHIVVFNALDHARSDVVEVPFFRIRPCSMPMHLEQPEPGDPHAAIWHNGTVIGRTMHSLPTELLDGKFELIDAETGERVPHQVSRIPDASYPMRFAAERHCLAGHLAEHLSILNFIARDVPAVGYKTFKVVRRRRKPSAETDLRLDSNTLENRFYKVVLDEQTGAVVSIYDKELRRELVDADAAYGVNEFFTRTMKEGTVETAGESVISPVRSGPVAVSLLVKGGLPGAPIRTQEIVLYGGIKRIDFFNRLLKDADGTRRFHVAFPFNVKQPRFRYESGLNVIRPVEDQLPGTTTDYYAAQHWVHVGDASRRLDEASSFVGDGGGAWGISWSAREAPMVQLGANWPDYVSPAHHGVTPDDFEHDFLTDPSQFEKGHIYSYVANNNFGTNCAVSQPGVINVTYSMTSGRGDWKKGRARNFGWGFCNPMPYAVIPGPQEGTLPTSHSFCQLDKPNVVLTTIKRAEDGDDLIVRLLETEGVEADVTVNVPFLTFGRAIETNVVEEDRRLLTSDGSSFSLRLSPWSLATVRLTSIKP